MRRTATDLAPAPVVTSLAADVGRPDVVGVSLAGGHGRCAVARVDFASGEPLALWCELTPGVRAPPLAVAAAAGRWALTVDGVGPDDLAARRVGGRGFALRAWAPPGALPWDAAATAIGATLDALDDGPDAPFGAGVSGGRFVPLRGTWADEWLAVARATHGRAAATGADLGPLGRALLAGVEEAAPALARASRFGLVHGSLGGESVAPGPHGPRVVGWEEALVGDRQVDVAALLALPPAALASIVRAAPDRFTAVDPERLRAYHLTWCLSQLALVGEAAALQGPARLSALDRVARHAREALATGFVQRRLAEAAAAEPAPPPPVGLDAVPALLHVVLASLATVEPPDPWWTACALGALLLADESPAETSAALLAARTVTVDAPGAWHADRAPGPSATLDAPGLAGALALTGAAAVARLGGDVSDGVARGLERAVRATAVTERIEGTAVGPVLGALVDLARGAGGVSALWDAARDLDPTVTAAPPGDPDTLARSAVGDDAGPLVAWLLRRARLESVPGGAEFVLRHGRSG